MNTYEKLYFLKQYTDSVGPIYGTENFCTFLYSLIKMRKPKQVVELGTGLGSVMLWAALALEENKLGTITTVDNGSAWTHLKNARPQMGPLFRDNYLEYINNLIDNFEFNSYINFIPSNFSISDLPNNLDIVFSDFAHGPRDILTLLPQILLKTSDTAVIMFDSASTYYSSYHTINTIVDLFNANKIPAIFDSYKGLREKVERSSFSVQHLVEAENRAQNSTACIYIQPADVFPHPITNMRF